MKTHKDLEFAVIDHAGSQRTFKKFPEACVFAVSLATERGATIYLDVLAWSVGAARVWAGDYGVKQYKEDPDASVFDRIEIKASVIGRVA